MDKFHPRVSQVRRGSPDYTSFEFFVPLANEVQLRTANDALCYRGISLARLGTVDRSRLAQVFPRADGLDGAACLD